MPVRYFDSSAVLSGLLEEKDHPAFHELWSGADTKISSGLLRIECVIAVRRAAIRRGFAATDAWAHERLDVLAAFMKELNFKAIDESIEEIVRLTPALADCRALDAIHVATALHFKPFAEGPIEIVTLDRRMRHLAGTLGFKVRPA
jgi:predicted nucleic acid-binding protein